IPKQGRIEVYPKRTPCIGNRKEVKYQPNSTDVDPGKKRCTDHRKYRHRLLGPVDPRTPFLPEYQKYRGYQCSSMADPDPPNKVGNIPSPAYGPVKIPGSKSKPYSPNDTQQSKRQPDYRHGKRNNPGEIGRLLR